MGITDKISGKVKQAVGDLTGDDRHAARASSRSARPTSRTSRPAPRSARSDKAAEVADLERRT